MILQLIMANNVRRLRTGETIVLTYSFTDPTTVTFRILKRYYKDNSILITDDLSMPVSTDGSVPEASK